MGQTKKCLLCITENATYDEEFLSQRAYFSAPRLQELRTKWNDAISEIHPVLDHLVKHLNTYKVCDLHFKESDIKKSYYDKSTNEIIYFPISKWVLKIKALPVSAQELETENSQNSSANENTEDVEIEIEEPVLKEENEEEEETSNNNEFTDFDEVDENELEAIENFEKEKLTLKSNKPNKNKIFLRYSPYSTKESSDKDVNNQEFQEPSKSTKNQLIFFPANSKTFPISSSVQKSTESILKPFSFGQSSYKLNCPPKVVPLQQLVSVLKKPTLSNHSTTPTLTSQLNSQLTSPLSKVTIVSPKMPIPSSVSKISAPVLTPKILAPLPVAKFSVPFSIPKVSVPSSVPVVSTNSLTTFISSPISKDLKTSSLTVTRDLKASTIIVSKDVKASPAVVSNDLKPSPTKVVSNDSPVKNVPRQLPSVKESIILSTNKIPVRAPSLQINAPLKVTPPAQIVSMLTNSKKKEAYSREKLKMDLEKIPLPCGWAYTVQEEDILFTQYCIMRKFPIFCFVSNDMETMISLGYEAANFIPFTARLKSFLDVKKCLNTLETLNWCLGIGFDNNNHSDLCLILTKKLNTRCKVCKTIRNNAQKQESLEINQIKKPLNLSLQVRKLKTLNSQQEAKICKLKLMVTHLKNKQCVECLHKKFIAKTQTEQVESENSNSKE